MGVRMQWRRLRTHRDSGRADQPPPGSVEAQTDPDVAGVLLFDPSIAPLLDEVEARVDHVEPEAVPELLAPIPLDLFTLLATHRPARWTRLSEWLPVMPEPGVQLGMTGATGEQVMLEAAGFVHRLLPTWRAQFGRPLSQARVLDYGIGWARVARLFYKFTPTTQLYGVDAWPPSLALAEASGFRGRLGLIPAAPERLPFETAFELVYAFSVFTHLSEDTARAAVRAIRASLAHDGLLAITIRPEDFWRRHAGDDTPQRLQEHASHGFAFRPGGLPDAGATYGDASITLDYIRREWPEFRIAAVEVNGADPHQLLVLLAPA